MRKSLPVIALAALAVLAGVGFAQVQKTPDILGRWTGTAVVGDDGTQWEIAIVIGKTDAGYTAKISDTNGMVPETELRAVTFKENKFACEFDLDTGAGPTLIKIELTLENETLKGLWSEPEGGSGAIELTLQK